MGGFQSLGGQNDLPDTGGHARIFAVPAAQATGNPEAGVVANLVSYLDFSPRNRELSTALARRFMRTLRPGHAETRTPAEIQDQFFSWLAPKVEPMEGRARTRRQFSKPSAADLRMIGLLDQYRAGGGKATGACPLFRAAYSDQV